MKQTILLINDDGTLRELLPTDAYNVVDAEPEQAREVLSNDTTASVAVVGDEAGFIGTSPIAKQIREKIGIIAETGAMALITGESGTGKEIAARAIHRASQRSGRFVKVSCGSLSGKLLEREIFGDADGDGKAGLSAGGTLLLDEVGGMDFNVQSRLAKALESGRFDGVHLIATTTRNLRDEPFMDDLYYKLSVVTLDIPPLRSRRDDIPLLIEHFAEYHAHKNGRKRIHFTPAAVDKLSHAHWDGNVRQLEGVIERAAVLSSGQILDAGDFHFDDRRDEQMSVVEETFRYGSIRDMERLMILNRLRENDDNRTRSAKTLDISVRTLRNKLHEYNVPPKIRSVQATPEKEPVLV